MVINYNKGVFILDSGNAIHAAMIADFADESKRQYFIDLLNADDNTAFAIYNSGVSFWDKEEYSQQINEAHNELFRQLCTERDYLTIGEIPIWELSHKYQDESLALQQWWIDTCELVEDYLATVTEHTALPIKDFINSLPKFDN